MKYTSTLDSSLILRDMIMYVMYILKSLDNQKIKRGAGIKESSDSKFTYWVIFQFRIGNLLRHTLS